MYKRQVLQYPVPITVPSTQYCCTQYSVSSYLVLCITVPGTQYCTVLSITVPSTQYSVSQYPVLTIVIPSTQHCCTWYSVSQYPVLSIAVLSTWQCCTLHSVLQYPVFCTAVPGTQCCIAVAGTQYCNTGYSALRTQYSASPQAKSLTRNPRPGPVCRTDLGQLLVRGRVVQQDQTVHEFHQRVATGHLSGWVVLIP